MQLTKPVIAGIVTGSIALITALVILILFLTGVIGEDSLSPAKADSDCAKAVEAFKADYKDLNGVEKLCEALKEGNFD